MQTIPHYIHTLPGKAFSMSAKVLALSTDSLAWRIRLFRSSCRRVWSIQYGFSFHDTICSDMSNQPCKDTSWSRTQKPALYASFGIRESDTICSGTPMLPFAELVAFVFVASTLADLTEENTLTSLRQRPPTYLASKCILFCELESCWWSSCKACVCHTHSACTNEFWLVSYPSIMFKLSFAFCALKELTRTSHKKSKIGKIPH